MTPQDIARVDEALRYGGVEELRAEVRAALERANDVGALDAWVARRTYNARRYESQLDVCVLVDCDAGQRIFTGADQDAARAAAAKAIEAGEG